MNKSNRGKLSGAELKEWGFKGVLWLFIVMASLRFAPADWLAFLKLDTWVAEHSAFIGLGLLLAMAFFTMLLANFVLDQAIDYLGNKRKRETIEHKVQLLDPAERAVLREFFLQGKTILTLPVDELAVKSLQSTNILECIGNVKHYAIHGATADYKISMLARSYLNRHLLRLPSGAPSPQELQQLLKSRPGFISNLLAQRKPQRAA